MRLVVHVQPNAKQTEVVGWFDESSIKIKIAAPPRDGKANAALIEFLAKRLGIARTSIDLIRGHTNTIKHFEIPLPADRVRDSLRLDT